MHPNPVRIVMSAKRFVAGSIAQITSAAGRFRRATSGMAAIEMAFIFPVMLIIYLGLVDVTDLLSAKRRVTLASSTLSDLVTQAPGSLTMADLAGFYAAIEPIMDPYPTATVGIQIYNFKIDGGTVSLRWSDTFGQSCGAAPTGAGFETLMTEGNDIVVARSCISLQPITGYVIGTGTHVMTKDTALRPRQSPTICIGGPCA
jgi:Flp pilus assembly protein TadG